MTRYVAMGNTKAYTGGFDYHENINAGDKIHYTTMGLTELHPNPPNTIGYSWFEVIHIYRYPTEVHLLGDWTN